MLYDPHRDLNASSFRDYAACKDPTERYVYSSRESCACSQFARHIGLYSEWMDAELGIGGGIWAILNSYAFGNAHSFDEPERFTWGGLSKRLEAAAG